MAETAFLAGNVLLDVSCAVEAPESAQSPARFGLVAVVVVVVAAAAKPGAGMADA